MARYEVQYTVYEDETQSTAVPNLYNVTTVVECFMPQQAQAMIEAQYGRRVHVVCVRQA